METLTNNLTLIISIITLFIMFFMIKIHKNKNKTNSYKIVKNTGTNSLVLIQTGANKATVIATLRQITGIDYENAKTIIESTPSKFMENISEKEAELTKEALEFVGAKVEIKK